MNKLFNVQSHMRIYSTIIVFCFAGRLDIRFVTYPEVLHISFIEVGILWG